MVMILYFCSKLVPLAQRLTQHCLELFISSCRETKARVFLSLSELTVLLFEPLGNLKVRHEPPELSKALWVGTGKGPTIFCLKTDGIWLSV